ncbi:MAG: hypothetical protein U9R56_04345, partial [candidate division Zixibacteria bacterium]|nr:hypothetical protein [candidate division Zixibacteria bacterium]
MRNRIYIVITVILCLFVSGCGSDEELAGGSGFLEATEVIVSSEANGRVTVLLFEEGTTLNRLDTLLLIDTTRLHLELAAVEAEQKVAKTRIRTARLKRKMAIEAENFAQIERDRIAAMLNSGTATEKQMDLVGHEYKQTVLNHEMADAEVKSIEAELDRITVNIRRVERRREDCFPMMPISGVVTEKYVDAGELLGTGM